MKNLNMQFWVHWLVYGFIVDSKKCLCEFLRLCKHNGVNGVELPWKPLMKLSPTVVAGALREFDIRKIAICCFFSKDGPDPLGSTRLVALQELYQCAQYASKLRKLGINVVCVDGPWAYQIGREYSEHEKSMIYEFVGLVRDNIASKFKLVFCLETLRTEEDRVFNSSLHAADVVRSAKSKWVRLHLDSFHLCERGEDVTIPKIISQCSDVLGWFHFSGTDRHTPGHINDTTPWQSVYLGFSKTKQKLRLPYGCFEGFGPAFRKGVPEIGAGFPEDLSPEHSVWLCRRTLAEHGFVKP